MLLNYMSGLYQKNYFNTVSSSQSGGADSGVMYKSGRLKASYTINVESRQWSVIITILFILVVIISYLYCLTIERTYCIVIFSTSCSRYTT